MLQEYQDLIQQTKTYHIGPSPEMESAYRELLVQGKSEKIKLYSPREYERIFDRYYRKVDRENAKWKAEHKKQAEKELEK